jgi:hypothetical protein
MDHDRFDDLTRWLASGASRRAAVQTLVAGAFAIGLSRLGVAEVAAKCVKPGKKCKKKHGKKKKCCGGAKCKGKKCKCTGGRLACGKTCCPPGQMCVGGQCVTGAGTCPTDGADFCNGEFDGNCNGDNGCGCFTTMANATRCGFLGTPVGFCGQCTNDGDCADFGPGAFCVKDTGAGCGCATGVGFCWLPCPS